MKSFDNEQSRSKWSPSELTTLSTHSTETHQGNKLTLSSHSTETHQGNELTLSSHSTETHQGNELTLSSHSTETHQGNELTLSSHSTETHQGNELTLSSHSTETHQGNELTHNSSENIHPLASAHCGLVPGLIEWNWCAPAHLRSRIKWHRWGMISPTFPHNPCSQEKCH